MEELFECDPCGTTASKYIPQSEIYFTYEETNGYYFAMCETCLLDYFSDEELAKFDFSRVDGKVSVCFNA